uniref:Uncharacterized protein n=1 Tax=Uncultured archaeon GZfos26G2 TaxID=3386331 RepID=Q64CW4_UNCAG|nr:hypothetical protein GZ19C8_24 [uncultured archaeon GZfos19C8]
MIWWIYFILPIACTVTLASPLCMNTWLPLCRTMIKPILFNDPMIFLPDTEGSLGTGNFHLKDFGICTCLFLRDLKNQLNCLCDISQSLFFCIALTYRSRELKTLSSISPFIRFFEFYCKLHFSLIIGFVIIKTMGYGDLF